MKIIADKEKELTFEINGSHMGNEVIVIESQGKEIYRGTDKSFTLKQLMNDSNYKFTIWTENQNGDKSDPKTFEATTIMPVQQPPLNGGSIGSTNTISVPPINISVPEQKEENYLPDNSNATTIPFKDLDKAFNKDQIVSLYEKGIIQGTSLTTFEPARPISRIEFMSLIVRALGMQNKDENVIIPFQDIDPTAWYVPELKAALMNGIAKGFNDKEFRPFDVITREQAAKMLGNALYSQIAPEGKTDYTDNSVISDWAKNEVTGLTMNQIVQGYPDRTFRPKSNMTRAESVALIYRVLETLQSI